MYSIHMNGATTSFPSITKKPKKKKTLFLRYLYTLFILLNKYMPSGRVVLVHVHGVVDIC